jgi:hypothetical protein
VQWNCGVFLSIPSDRCLLSSARPQREGKRSQSEGTPHEHAAAPPLQRSMQPAELRRARQLHQPAVAPVCPAVPLATLNVLSGHHQQRCFVLEPHAAGPVDCHAPAAALLCARPQLQLMLQARCWLVGFLRYSALRQSMINRCLWCATPDCVGLDNPTLIDDELPGPDARHPVTIVSTPCQCTDAHCLAGPTMISLPGDDGMVAKSSTKQPGTDAPVANCASSPHFLCHVSRSLRRSCSCCWTFSRVA